MVTVEEKLVIRAPIERCFDLARSVEVHVQGNVHWGETAVATGGVTTGLLKTGDRVTWRARHFAVRFHLTSEITQMTAATFFQDKMVRGPFASMQHDHYFRAISPLRTEMRDVFRFSAPFGFIGIATENLLLRNYMSKLLKERSEVIKRMAETNEWRAYLPQQP